MLWIVVGVVVLGGVIAFVMWAGQPVASNFTPGTLEFEADLSRGPLMLTIMQRQQEQEAATDAARKAELQAEIDFLCKQVDEITALIERNGNSPGRGYVGFDAFGATESSWAKAGR